jgi:hypothetical protein
MRTYISKVILLVILTLAATISVNARVDHVSIIVRIR